MDFDDETIAIYAEEAEEHLGGIEDDLLQIETEGADVDKELVNKVFRAIHSIKGGAGFFGLDGIKSLGHDMENVLNMIRNDELVGTPQIVSVLLESADILKQMFDDIKSSNDRDITDIVARLQAIAEGDATDVAVEQESESPPDNAPNAVEESEPEPEVAASEAEDNKPAKKPKPAAKKAPKQDKPAAAPKPTAKSEPTAPAKTADTPAAGARSGAADSKLRVSVQLLDQLMTLAGELVLTRNQMSLATAADDISRVHQATQRLDQITSELQEAIVSTRMQPVGVVFTKFRRVVRDMARQLSKNIDLIIEGEEVELDKSIIEGLSDPLTHLVRNAVDHGIEMPAARKSSGKPEEAKLRLRAFHEAGQVIIEVADDGGGIDPQKIKAKALEKQLRDAAALDSMSDAELVRLIFLPGFSTATELTEISGRGVGMDVVNTNLTKMGGVVDISSSVGVGTTLRIKLPLTLAIIPSLIVGLGTKRYAVPQVNVRELVRIPSSEVTKRIQSLGDSQIMRLRGELLPIVRLSEILNIEPVYRDRETGELRRDRRERLDDRRREEDEPIGGEQRGSRDRRNSFESAVNVVVVLAGTLRYGLVVDQLLDSEEIVVKPLDRHFKSQKFYAGATIQGDGGVAMILDVVELSNFVDLDASRSDDLDTERRKTLDDEAAADKSSLLLVKSGEKETFAIPLALITRIEKEPASKIELSGARRSIIYRGVSLPLFAMDDAAAVEPLIDCEEVYIVVFSVNQREVGLVIASIEDTVNISVEFDRETFRQPGIFGSAIINDRTTFLVDLLGVVEAVDPSLSGEITQNRQEQNAGHTILVVEDSKFFLDHLRGFLESAGYSVKTAMDGREGLDALEAHQGEINLVMTDIEMPVMNGFEFTEQIRADSRFKHLPVIAVTSLAGDVDKAHGFESGVNQYLIKLDKEEILRSLDQYIGHPE